MTTPSTLRWVEGWQALEPLFPAWQDLVQRTGAEIFLSPQWLRAWWPEHGRGRRLLALVAEEEGRLIALLPFMLDRFWLGPIPLRIARLAATDPNAMVLALPVEPGHQATLLARACHDLTTRFGASFVSFTPVSDRAAFLPDLLALPGLTGLRQPQGTHSFFDLPHSYAAYSETMISNKRRGQIRREISGLTATFAMENSHFRPSPAQVDDFVAFHNIQWQAAGKGGHFSDWPRSHQVYRALAPLSQEGQGLHLFTQTGSEGPLASQLCLISGQTCHWRLPARTLDARADKLSIGKIGLVLMIQDLIAMGVTRIEGGRGVYDYKTQHGGQDVPVSRLILARPIALARLVLQAAVAWANLVDLAYYRIWFKKIAPRLRQRLGLPARPLWRLWIGSRI